MATKLLYLDAFDVIDCNATVTRIRTADDDQMVIELDQTCFYPRGGGQDWDNGIITSSQGVYVVSSVRLNASGVAEHYGTFQGGEFTVGVDVECHVDKVRRFDNTRLHSAGHVVDMAIHTLGLPWVASKGAHYPNMSFVEYDGVDASANETSIQFIQGAVHELCQRDYLNQILFMSPSEMIRYCKHLPTNMPTNKPSRIVLYADDFGIPCGGTHVQRLKDIGIVTITKVKSKKGITKVTYRVEGVN